MSSLDNDSKPELISRGNIDDDFSPMDKILPKGGTSGRTGDNDAPKINILNASGSIGLKFLMPPQVYDQEFRARIVRMIDDHEKY